MTTMVAPYASRTYQVSPSGNVYVSDQYGIISNVVGLPDVASLQSQGCIPFTPPVNELIGKLNAADFNVTTDQLIPISTSNPFRIRRIVVVNTTVNGMPTAAGGLYTGAGKTGTTIVAAGQVYTGLTNALTAIELTYAPAATLVFAAGITVYLSLTTPRGSAAKADLFIYGDAYPTS